MKTLYSELTSLIPDQNYKEAKSLTDQLEEATKYIKKLKENLERMKEKKEQLMETEKINKCMSNGMMVALRTPQIVIHDMGSALEVILRSGFDSQFMFYEIIRVLHEEGTEVVSASSSVVDNTFFHRIHSEVGESALGFGAARISTRLKNFVQELANAL